MRVLIAFDSNPKHSNPYVRTLAEGIIANGVDLTCSLSEFWTSCESYEIIHIQWPQSLISTGHTIGELKTHLNTLKREGHKIVVTCHNLGPHYSCDKNAIESYRIVYESADCIIHMGSYSLELFRQKYPNTIHSEIEHHIYNSIYPLKFPNKKDARKRLGLNPRYKYVLCFGNFRDQEERDLVFFVANALKDYNIRVLAPSFYSYTLKKKIWKSFIPFCEYVYYKYRYRLIYFRNGYVSDKQLPFYYAASDVAFIQRLKIINSGNLPMALFAGKVVVGPNTGNVGPILKRLGNPTFDIDNISTASDAILKAMSLDSQGLGLKNKQYANENLSIEQTGRRIKSLYERLLGFESSGK